MLRQSYFVTLHITQEDIDNFLKSKNKIPDTEVTKPEETTSIDVINTFAEYFNVSAIDILNGCFYFV